jgi:ribonuclease HI
MPSRTPAARRLVIHTDGAARGNPGPAGAGFVVETGDGRLIQEGSIYLGERTNNQAEYEALLHALEAVAPDSETHLDVYSDSQLMVRQLTGEYRVKHEDLKGRHAEATIYLGRASSASVRHVPRDGNERADELANRAIDVHLEASEGLDGQTVAGGGSRESGSRRRKVRAPQGRTLAEAPPGANARHPSG